MTVPDEAVYVAQAAWLGHKSVRSPGNSMEKMRAALEAAAPIIAAQSQRQAADYLETRMDQSDPASHAEQQYQAGYADAVARLIFHAEGKS